MQNGTKNWDAPWPGRPHRIYVAMTNHCNRECPWCSTYSSPKGTTWLDIAAFKDLFPTDKDFEIQLEGGEPTLHPQFMEFVRACRDHSGCRRIVVVTNGTRIPRDKDRRIDWLKSLGESLTIKLSINHYLLDRDPDLIRLAQLLKEDFDNLGGDRILILNVRLRKGFENNDERVKTAVQAAGLERISNIFFLQRYGLASNQTGWDAPFLVGTNFSMVNPDGRLLGPDLIARSEAMKALP